MKLDVWAKSLKGSAASQVMTFLDADKSGEIYNISELEIAMNNACKIGERCSPRKNSQMEKYTLYALANGQPRLFYGHPAVIERARKYTKKKPNGVTQ